MYNVTEFRGMNIFYHVFYGTFEDCKEWMIENTQSHPQNKDLRINFVSESEFYSYTITKAND